jgi:hypothetical protein
MSIETKEPNEVCCSCECKCCEDCTCESSCKCMSSNNNNDCCETKTHSKCCD